MKKGYSDPDTEDCSKLFTGQKSVDKLLQKQHNSKVENIFHSKVVKLINDKNPAVLAAKANHLMNIETVGSCVPHSLISIKPKAGLSLDKMYLHTKMFGA